MPKNIVVCCDGTSNEFATAKTNVVNLFYTLVRDPEKQVAYYHPGLGTTEPAGALTPFRRRIAKLLGKAVGAGLESDIAAAYVFLMDEFEPGDQVFLFGFSRGAYTARAITALLKMYGLMDRGNETAVPYAIRMLMAIKRSRTDEERNANFALAREFKHTFATIGCKPHFVGVWDTVSSVGWLLTNPLALPYTAGNDDIAIGRHAVAIDERRTFFASNLWRPGTTPGTAGPADLKQVWFPGTHRDVGGGRKESECGLSKIALEWMLREGIAAGLLTDPSRVDVVLGRGLEKRTPPTPGSPIHESLSLWWWPAEFLFKRRYDYVTKQDHWHINRGRRRFIPPGSKIHVSAKQRGSDYLKLLPADVEFVD